MPWLDVAVPVRMKRVALVAPAGSLHDVLVAVAATAAVEIDRGNGQHPPGEAARRLQQAGRQGVGPALAAGPPDFGELAEAGRFDLLAGEAQLEEYAGAAVERSGASALAGWIPAGQVPDVAARVARAGGAVVPLPPPAGVDPPTLLSTRGMRRSLTPLVQTYGTVPYPDIDPTWLAWVTYVLMFGMMFGDAGHGVLLMGIAWCLFAGWPRRASRYRRAWPFVAGAGLAATVFGLLYGEFFGPTGLIPALWLNPVDRPVPLLLAAVGIGAALLAGAYALGTVNRWREGG